MPSRSAVAQPDRYIQEIALRPIRSRLCRGRSSDRSGATKAQTSDTSPSWAITSANSSR